MIVFEMMAPERAGVRAPSADVTLSRRSLAQQNDHVKIVIELYVVFSTLPLRVIDFVGEGAALALLPQAGVACGKAVLRADELVEYGGASLATYCNCATFIASC
jgi:hypothetical protein